MAEVHGNEEGRGAGVDPSSGSVAATLAYVARSLVAHPEDVRISTLDSDDDRVVYRVDVHPEDAGRVIGRGGRVARAIRIVAKAAAAREGSHVMVQIGEPRPDREPPVSAG